MNARIFAPSSRRQLLAAGVLFWTSLVLSSAFDITLKELRITCVAEAPTPTYTVDMTVVNGMDCPMGWITLHSSATFSPHIINLTAYVVAGGEASYTTRLTGAAPGTMHSLPTRHQARPPLLRSSDSSSRETASRPSLWR